jgi:hypothetical protein
MRRRACESTRSFPCLDLRAAFSHGITLLIFFTLSRILVIAVTVTITIILSALALARRCCRRDCARSQSGIRLCRMSAQRTGRVRAWTYLSYDHLSNLLHCLSFRLHLRFGECHLRGRQAALQLNKQVLCGLDASSQRIDLIIIIMHDATKVGLHSVDTGRKCVSAV